MATEQFTQHIQRARDRHAQKTTTKAVADKLPENITDLIKAKNIIKKRWQRHRRQADRRDLDAVTAEVNNLIIAHRDGQWQRRLEALAVRDNSLWQLTKALRKDPLAMPTLVQQGIGAITSLQKAELLSKQFSKVCNSRPNTTPEHERITQHVQENITSHHPPPPLNPMTFSRILITPAELQQVLDTLPYRKSPGPDQIDNMLLRNLSRKAKVQFVHILNGMLRLQHFPAAWKHATIVPIPKPGKNPESPLSYRPISLLNSMSKVAERLLLSRIDTIDNRLHITPVHQFGFRGGHSTNMAVARVAHDAILNIKSHKCTAVLLLDMERAFDTVWHEGLLYKLLHYRFPVNLVHLLRSYLSDRTFQVRVGVAHSKLQPLIAGVPQGTVLAPKLYTLYTADIPTYPHTRLIQYADDTLIYASSFYAQAANTHLRNHMIRLTQYYTTWKLNINAQKTEQLLITRKFTNCTIFTKLKIHDTLIDIARKARYLGVILDRTLCFKPHVSHLVSRTYAAAQKLYPLLAPNSSLSMQNRILLYKVVLRPALTHACPIWVGMSKAQYHRLQTMQNKLLRLVTKSGRYTSNNVVHDLAGVPRIADYIQDLAQKFYDIQIPKSPMTRDITHIRDGHGLNPTHRLLYQTLPIYTTPLPD